MVDKNLKEIIDKTKLSEEHKKMLSSSKDRTELSINLSKILFIKKANDNKKNYNDHNSLSYLNDDETFNKNVRGIIKKL